MWWRERTTARWWKCNIYLVSGSPAVAGLTPVTCATMKTRTTPWNWPPGWFVATAPKNRSAKDLATSAPFPPKFPGTFNTRSLFTHECGGGVRANATADPSTDKIKGGKNGCPFWLWPLTSFPPLGSLQPYGNAKPCMTCGSMMTRGTRTSHWEGGLGCRNKAKMSRWDFIIATGKNAGICLFNKHSLFPFSSEMIDRNTPTSIKRFRGKQPVKRNNWSRRLMIFVIDRWPTESVLIPFVISMKSPTINQVFERVLTVSSFKMKLPH